MEVLTNNQHYLAAVPQFMGLAMQYISSLPDRIDCIAYNRFQQDDRGVWIPICSERNTTVIWLLGTPFLALWVYKIIRDCRNSTEAFQQLFFFWVGLKLVYNVMKIASESDQK